LQLARAPVPLLAAFDQVGSDIQPQLKAKRLHFEQRSPDVSVIADITRLRQILLNLLSNAIKFTPESGTISLTAQIDGTMVTVSVRDNGVGIAPEHQAMIFEEFQQVGESTKGITEGTGLGLAIVKRLVEQHGGTITVESDVGAGSCFTFSIPLAAAPSLEGSNHSAATLTDYEPLLLVVDDEPVAQELLVRYLTTDGYRTDVAGSAREALERIRSHPPDAITLDIMMSGTSGWEILHLLKSDPLTTHIPVIVVSVVDERQMGVLLGADEYFVKPVERTALLHALKRVLGSDVRGSRSCLVVDDDPAARALMTEVVKSLGCRAIDAEDGERAVAVLDSETPDVVVLDLIMPGLNGIEVMERIRSNPRLSKIPVHHSYRQRPDAG
jgi:CheY-like chemotaxis protein